MLWLLGSWYLFILSVLGNWDILKIFTYSSGRIKKEPIQYDQEHMGHTNDLRMKMPPIIKIWEHLAHLREATIS